MTQFTVDEAKAVLRRTPSTLRALLEGLPDPWVTTNEGPETWSPFDILGHMIHGERADWIGRAKHILDRNPGPFEPFDRSAHFAASKGKALADLLDEFATLRTRNLEALDAFDLDSEKLALTGRHPTFGSVTLEQLLATWTVHDLSHLAQITRVMAKRYRSDVGPWREFIPILDR